MKNPKCTSGRFSDSPGSSRRPFASTPATELGVAAIEAALARAGVDKADVSETILGQVLTGGAGQNPARQTHVQAGLPIERAHRVTYADWIWILVSEAARQGWRIFHLGGAPGVAERAARLLSARYPELEMGTHHGYFDQDPEAAENLRILERLADYRPDILMVGMGMPRQEHWILDSIDRLNAGVILPCGACMDYVAGVVPTPPRWAGRIGLEWLFRLVREPVRLSKRYLVEPLFLVGPFAGELIRRRILGRSGPRQGRGRPS